LNGRYIKPLSRFKNLAIDSLPPLFLIPLTIFALYYESMPNPPASGPSLNLLILDGIFFAISMILVLIIPRYDRWLVRPLLASSRSFSQMFMYWALEPLMAFAIFIFGVVLSNLTMYWGSLVPYLIMYYGALAMVIVRLKSHVSLINERIARLTGR